MYFAIVNPSTFQSGKENTNGEKPVILDPIYGVVPFRRIIDGTIAKRAGLEIGKTYMVKIVMVDNVNPATGIVSLQPQVTRLGDGAISALELALNGKAFQGAYGNGKVEPKADVTNDSPKAKEEEEEEEELVDTDGNGVPKDTTDPLDAPSKK